MPGFATESDVFTTSFEVASDLSLKQFHLAKFTVVNGRVDFATAVADVPAGVIQDNNASVIGNATAIRMLGLSEVVAGGVVAAGDRITTDAQGRGVKAAPAVGVNNAIWGVAKTSAGAAGERFSMFVSPQIMQG